MFISNITCIFYFIKKNDRETESPLGLEQINMSNTWRGTALKGTYISTRFASYNLLRKCVDVLKMKQNMSNVNEILDAHDIFIHGIHAVYCSIT